MKILCRIWLALLFIHGIPAHSQIPTSYKGKPYTSGACMKGPQIIPGRIELAYYDMGGEGIAYHDETGANEGAELSHRHENPGISGSRAFFRENEGVDITYTKYWTDFSGKNLVYPPVHQLYIGWQEDGEWTCYTVDVKVAGKYRVIALYGYMDNRSSLWINDRFATTLVLPVNTGYWHHWNKVVAGEVNFEHTGLNLLTLKYNKGANLAYLDFVLAGDGDE